MEQFNEESMKKVLTGMHEKIKEDEDTLYRSVKENLTIDCSDFEKFYLSFLYPFSKIVAGAIRARIGDHTDIEFIYKNSQFIDCHYKSLIERIEGMECCADKSRTIIRSLVRWFNNGELIKFDLNQKYTFHIPKHVFTNHEDIVEFYNGLKYLYYGNPTKYLISMSKITNENKRRKEQKNEG